MKKRTITVKGTEGTVIVRNEQDYISLTDMIRGFGGETVMYCWLRNKNTVGFLGIWERINNPDFKPLEFERFMEQAGLNRFSLSPTKWVESTGAIGMYSKAGRGGGTYAHKDIAFEFGSWLSPEFKLYLITEFQRLKEAESSSQTLEWSLPRTLAKVNYRIHTDAIKEHLVPPVLSREQMSGVYSTEADRLNMALFGLTVSEWRRANSDLSGNMRDHATLEQLVVLSNMESINALLIRQGLDAPERLRQLNSVAITQIKSLLSVSTKRAIEKVTGKKR